MNRKSFLMAVLALAFGIVACNKTNTDIPGNTDGPGGTDPVVPPGPTTTVDFPFYEEFPIECGNLYAEGSDVGVTIEIKSVEDRNFVFELRPGAMVQSFKMDVYPIASLYNSLLNSRDSGHLPTGDPFEINEAIRAMLFNQEGAGGYAFSVNTPVEGLYSNAEEFLQIEFDWMSTTYAPASAIAIPDCGFLIAVVASSESDINDANQEELTLCYVHTTSQPLIGDPGCDIKVQTGYKAFEVNHILTPDAYGVYYFGGLSDEIDAYIDTFGDTMFRDFIRTLYSAPSTEANPESLSYSTVYSGVDDQGNPVSYHNIKSTTCAVAVDANLTPQADYSRVDFSLPELPADVEIVVPSLAIIKDRIAAAYFEFYAEIPKECNAFFWNIYTAEEKARWDNESSTNLMKEAIRLVQSDGYGITNYNFAWDKSLPDDQKATGASARVKETVWGGLVPGTTYYIGYTARDGFGRASSLVFSEPVTLDERNLVSPADCKVKDLQLTLENPTRTSFKQNITYDPSTVSMVYVQYMTKDNNPGLTKDSPWTDWVEFIDAQTFAGEYCDINCWAVEESGNDPWTWTGMTPDTEYTVFLCAEDFDGNMSEMQFATITTKDVSVGPNPTMELTFGEAPETALNGADWRVTYTIRSDVEYFIYASTDSVADINIPGITQSALNDIANSGYDYETWYSAIYDWMALGFEENGGGMRADGETASSDWKGNQTVIASCIAVGRKDGEPVYRMYTLICKDGKAQTLEEIFGIE